MNKGGFYRHCELLLIHITNLSKKKQCRATTAYLAKSIGRSISSTKRYLRSLEFRGIIKRTTSGFKRNTFTRKPYKLRTIEVVDASPNPHFKQILNVYFDKKIHGRVKNKKIREIMKSPDFKLINYTRTQDKANFKLKLQNNTTVIAAYKPPSFEEMQKINEANDLYDLKARFQNDLNEKCDKILRQLYDGSIPIRGESSLERLINFSIESFRKFEVESEELFKPSLEEKKEKAALWASNSFIKDGEYWITIFLGGQISHEVKLKQYIPWDETTDYYKLFIKAFNEK